MFWEGLGGFGMVREVLEYYWMFWEVLAVYVNFESC